MQEVGYTEVYANSGVGQKSVYENIQVKEAIARLDAKTRQASIASRKIRQEFWTNVMQTAPSMADRLRASELLGRSEADFTDNLNSQQTQQPDTLTIEEIEAYKAAAKAITAPKLAKQG